MCQSVWKSAMSEILKTIHILKWLPTLSSQFMWLGHDSFIMQYTTSIHTLTGFRDKSLITSPVVPRLPMSLSIILICLLAESLSVNTVTRDIWGMASLGWYQFQTPQAL